MTSQEGVPNVCGEGGAGFGVEEIGGFTEVGAVEVGGVDLGGGVRPGLAAL